MKEVNTQGLRAGRLDLRRSKVDWLDGLITETNNARSQPVKLLMACSNQFTQPYCPTNACKHMLPNMFISRPQL